MQKIDPEYTARMVIDTCSDCDVCRFLMDSDCLMTMNFVGFNLAHLSEAVEDGGSKRTAITYNHNR